MSEKYTFECNGNNCQIFENNVWLKIEEVVDLLNEQQATISALKEENDILKQKLRKNYIANKQYEEMKRLQEENEQLRKKYDNLYSAIEKTARDMAEKRIYEMEDFDVFQRITDYVEELDE